MLVGNKSMDHLNKREELLAAWRAFNKISTSEGWQTINLSNIGACKLKAGRKFPSNEEALLVGFNRSVVRNVEQFPKGKGFIVAKADIGDQEELVWISLSRQLSGNLDMFILMAIDLMNTLELPINFSEQKLFKLFLSRIKTWQDFMQRDEGSLLSLESQLGLVGELGFLKLMLVNGVEKLTALRAWVGPMNGLHDFEFKNGAVEVKSTASTSNFVVCIGSLSQLDPLIKSPLFLAGFKLEESIAGHTLPDLILELRDIFKDDIEAVSIFNSKIILAGYMDSHANQYTNGYLTNGVVLYSVSDNDSFPYLSEANVPLAVVNANYEIDLTMVEGEQLNIQELVEKMGVNN